MYQALKASRSEFVPIRNLHYHVRVWGEPDPARAPLVLVHGWMDVSASWQFMVDALAQERWIVAPDWRGFGLTRAEGPAPDSYWFPDYLADLDALLDHYAPEQPVDLVGHSMGGNVVMVYAGARPQRIHRLVNLEGFGMPATQPAQAPGRYAQWMDEVKALHRGQQALKAYDSPDAVARRLMKTNPRLAQDKADWLARQWASPNAQGQWEILGDAAHKVVSAYLYRVDETLEMYRRISAPVLSVTASDDSLTQWWKGRFTLAEHHERLRAVPRLDNAVVNDAGHMLHHDQPQVLAQTIEHFLARADLT
ncbi:MAG: alpha/beta hydrolase [Hydrogenophaga sp.]|uniref:alpha/beta fold hydrolase n=1 Tax=Hydrogenophaga sp. TaxID=1904254 RepID=UPI001BC196FE|nr:alpha/beta hydrolase [Hydrogenophaga sp.]MBS3912251.1 alpha/beta hydrolase [Hydrogenophaga sp.]MDO9146501.1 alpha/beta hydrolase [Hydrogenophaga sp.]MDO9605041.1 alpha/beta hydrolase [Hydrogenophaga sp.]